MRIVHLADVRFWNASAQYAVDLAMAQMQHGASVTFIAGRNQPCAHQARARGLVVFEHDFGPLHLLDALTEVRRLARRTDVLHAHHGSVQNLALLATAVHKRPLVIRTRVDVRPAKGGVLTRQLYNHRLDGVIVPGEDSRRRYVETLGIRPEKLHVVYGGVDHQRFYPDPARRADVRAQLGLDAKAVVFGFVGRLQPVKAPEIFLQAAQLVFQRNPRAVFLLAGRPVGDPAELQYRTLAERMRSFVRWCGEVGDIAAWMNALDVGIITSVASEAHCRVALEMMATGVPVIGTDIGVIPEVVTHEETGYIVRSRDVTELASRIEALAQNASLRTRLASQARATIERRFTFAHWARATGEVYWQAELARTADGLKARR